MVTIWRDGEVHVDKSTVTLPKTQNRGTTAGTTRASTTMARTTMASTRANKGKTK